MREFVEYGTMGICIILIYLFVGGVFIPSYVVDNTQRQLDEARDTIQRISEQIAAASEAEALVAHVKAQPVPFDPDYAAINLIRPEFTDDGDLVWYSS